MQEKGTSMKTELRTNNLTPTALAIVREARAARQTAIANRRIRDALRAAGKPA